MKTQEEKLRHVMEAAGDCWHNFESHAAETMGHYYWKCSKCPEQHDFTNLMVNPSPDDLNELFRLVEKLGWSDVVTGETADGDYFADIINSDVEVMIGNSRAEALLSALFIATGGVE